MSLQTHMLLLFLWKMTVNISEESSHTFAASQSWSFETVNETDLWEDSCKYLIVPWKKENHMGLMVNLSE